MAELVDAPDLGSGVLRREGSSPFRCTDFSKAGSSLPEPPVLLFQAPCFSAFLHRKNYKASRVLRDASEFKLDASEFKFGGPEFLRDADTEKANGTCLSQCPAQYITINSLSTNYQPASFQPAASYHSVREKHWLRSPKMQFPAFRE